MNRFKLGKMGTDTTSENMVIGIDDQGDTGYAAWMQDGSVSTIGVIMMGLELFDADHTTPLKESQVTGIEWYDYIDPDLPKFKDAAEEFAYWADYWGYSNINPQYDSNVRQADFYHQRYANQDRADFADFVYHAGHGNHDPALVMTYANGDNNVMDPTDKRYFRFDDPGRIHNGIEISEAEFDSDGWDTDPEWVWYTACDVLKGFASGTSGDNEMQTLLYHGTHFLFGYHHIVHENQVVDAAYDFWYHIYFDDCTVEEAFIHANQENGINCWAYYYHTNNHDEYLWGFHDGPKFDCIDRSDIDYEAG